VICFSREPSAAFHVTKDDPRLVARDITHGPTFVVPGVFSLNMTAAKYYSSFSTSSSHEELLNTITDSIMEGFRLEFHNSHDGSVFAVGSEPVVIRDAQYVVIQGSASLFALNSTSPTNMQYVDTWYNHALSTIASKVNPVHGNVVTPQTFKVHPTCFKSTFSPFMFPCVTA